MCPLVIMVLLFFVQKGELLRAVFRVNAHNRLEVCPKTCYVPISCGCMQLVMKCEASSFDFLFYFRPTARSMGSKLIFSLAVWWLKTEL